MACEGSFFVEFGVWFLKKRFKASATSPRGGGGGGGGGGGIAQSDPSLPVVSNDGGSMRSWKTKQTMSTPNAADDSSTKRSWRGKKESAIVAPAAVVSLFSEENNPLVLQESRLALEVSLVVLDTTMMFVEAHLEALMKPKNSDLQFVFDVFNHLLHMSQTSESISNIFKFENLLMCVLWLFSCCSKRAAQVLILQFKNALFVEQTGFAQSLTYRLMVLFSSLNGAVRSHAAALVALLLRENFLARESGERMLLAATIAVNRLNDPMLKPSFKGDLFSESVACVRKACASFDLKSVAFDELADQFCSTVRVFFFS
jgi:hypothetical protein